jgi:RND superfamily putative drug exporter
VTSLSPPTSTVFPAGDQVGVFGRLAGWSQRHRWTALLLWVVAVGVTIVGAQVAGSSFHDDFSLPGTESQAATDLLTRHDSREAGGAVRIVFADQAGLGRDRTRVEAMLDQVRGLPSVVQVSSPYADPSALSPDGTIGFATVTLDDQPENVPTQDVTAIIDMARAAERDGLRVELGGEAVTGAEEGSGGPAEGAGILAALVILVLLFGSLVAAAVPLVTALFAVGGAIALITLASHAFTIADLTPPIMALVGLGVGVDYALLIFYRYRTELIRAADRSMATRIALDAAGRTVFFAGCTVIIALLGLVALGLGSLQGVALAVALAVLVTMAASLVLLPALLAIFGRRIERHVRKRAARAEANGRQEGRRWRALASTVQRHPLPALLVAVVAMLALAAPVLDMRLGFADPGNNPPDTTSRQAYDLLAEGFGPGFNGPLFVVTDGDAAAAAAVRDTLGQTAGTAATAPPLPSPVVCLSALLLLLVFRSLLIPVKAALLNLLSIGAALGVITAVFQYGWFGGQPGPIEAFIPVMIFAIVFGLSMDYEVFLVSRCTRSGCGPGTIPRRYAKGWPPPGRSSPPPRPS